jgi:hypothetical protein
LISLIKRGKVRVFGSKWDRINISARPLSYLSANLILTTTSVCYGLMYPYQRGKSLSGRMWQAPIQGCVVISENDTNLFECPGVYPVDSFFDLSTVEILPAATLTQQASDFWIMKTKLLAKDLDLSIDWNQVPRVVFLSRILMFVQHCEFYFDLYISKNILRIAGKTKVFIKLLKK